MELLDIETAFKQEDFQVRLKAIAALKTYEDAIAVPIPIRTLHDPEFLVRRFVAMGLSKHRTADAFAALLEILKLDNTPNVRAEAANALSFFGRDFPEYVSPDPPGFSEGYATFIALLKENWQTL